MILHLKRFIKKVVVFAGLDSFIIRRSNSAIILGFHYVGTNDGSMLFQRVESISPRAFEEILCYLQSVGYSFVSLDEIVNSIDRSRKVAITFDDGFRSVYTNAFSILRKFQAPFTVFLTTAMLSAHHLLWLHRMYAAVDRLAPEKVFRVADHCSLKIQPGIPLKQALEFLIGHERPERLLLFADALASEAQLTELDEVRLAERLYLLPDEVVEMMQGGMTIGAHGHNHWRLETLEQSQTEAEIVMCKGKIKEAFGVQASHYALPYGRPNPYVRSVLERLGFKSLCTAKPGLVWMDTNLYSLPRLMVGDVLDLAGQITLLHLQWLVTGSQIVGQAR